MRLTIATKLFLGFLFVIVLNVSFLVVVNKMGNTIGITKILKYQNDVKNNLLRLTTLHRVQGPSIISYERIGRRESVENFLGISESIVSLIDTVNSQIDMIIATDGRLRGHGRDERTRTGIVQLQSVLRGIDSNNLVYASKFSELVRLYENGAPREEKARLREEIDHTETLVTERLDLAEAIINRLTEVRISEIGNDVTEVKTATVLILFGVTVFSILFAFVFSRTTTDSLRRLKEAASQIGKADFNIKRTRYPNDETGDLANAFFAMAGDLRRKQEELIRSKRLAAIGELVASVNHEINNPLMIISGNAQFLEMSMEGYPDEMKERVKTILEETNRISRVTRKMREIKNPITEDYTSTGEQMINLDKSTQ